MKNVKTKSQTAIIALALLSLLLTLFLLGSLIGGYVASRTTAENSLRVSDAQAEQIAKDAVAFESGAFALKKVEKKVRWLHTGFRPDNAYYVYEVEFFDKARGFDVEVYVDARYGEVTGIEL